MSKGTNSSIPNIKWAQRKDILFITIDATEIKNQKIDIIDGKFLKFEGSNTTHDYLLEFEFYDEVLKEDSKNIIETRNIFLKIKKKTKGPYWPRLTKDNYKHNWIGVDWRYFIEEDEEEEEDGPHYGNEKGRNIIYKNILDFSNFNVDDEIEDQDDLEENYPNSTDDKKYNLDYSDAKAN